MFVTAKERDGEAKAGYQSFEFENVYIFRDVDIY